MSLHAITNIIASPCFNLLPISIEGRAWKLSDVDKADSRVSENMKQTATQRQSWPKARLMGGDDRLMLPVVGCDDYISASNRAVKCKER